VIVHGIQPLCLMRLNSIESCMIKQLIIFGCLLTCTFTTLGCTSKSLEYLYYEKGVLSKINPPDSLLSTVMNLVEKSDKQIKLIVSPELVSSIRKKDSCVEIKFASSKVITTQLKIKYKINKILIPLTGKYRLSEDSGKVIIFIGENQYFSGPLENSDGKLEIQEIQKMIQPK
jgi:hypothetical protein